MILRRISPFHVNIANSRVGRGELSARVPGLGARKAHPAPLAAAERPHDDLERQAENNQVGDHLSGHHQPGRVALGGDVTEPHSGEHRDREIQPVRVGQMPAEVARRQLGQHDIGGGKQQQEERDARGQRLDGPQPRDGDRMISQTW
jgi:hypothetical protein